MMFEEILAKGDYVIGRFCLKELVSGHPTVQHLLALRRLLHRQTGLLAWSSPHFSFNHTHKFSATFFAEVENAGETLKFCRRTSLGGWKFASFSFKLSFPFYLFLWKAVKPKTYCHLCFQVSNVKLNFQYIIVVKHQGLFLSKYEVFMKCIKK